MAGEASHRVFRFGMFEADEAEGELRKHGVRVKLHYQPFQVLVMLLERPSELVTREEMRRRLWGEDTFVDFDHGLNSVVNKIREALSDSVSSPRYVETVSGKGYRFIAPVSQVSPATPAPDSVLSAPDELPALPRNPVRILLLLVQALYLCCYLVALAHIREIDDIFMEARLLPPFILMALLVTTAAILIPVRLFVVAAVAFNLRQLPSKFGRIFPWLLPLDLLWALSPFLLVHHVVVGLALGMCAALVYLPFAQRSLVLMYGRGR